MRLLDIFLSFFHQVEVTSCVPPGHFPAFFHQVEVTSCVPPGHFPAFFHQVFCAGAGWRTEASLAHAPLAQISSCSNVPLVHAY